MKKNTILLVEDDELDVISFERTLKKLDIEYDLYVAHNGKEALNLLTDVTMAIHPEVILLDLNLPQRDGKDLLRHVKAIPMGSDIRVVIVTGSTNPADRVDTLALGADAFFVKPFHLNEFMQLGHLIKHLAFEHPRWEDSSSTV